MKRSHLRLVLFIGLLGGLAITAAAQPYPNPQFCLFYDSLGLTAFNGQKAPVGSLVRAYDPRNLLIGVDTVGIDPANAAGFWGFMDAYGDNPLTPELNEGAVNGEAIHFTLNGRPATIVAGDSIWAHQALKRMQLAAAGTVGIQAWKLPNDTLVAPDWKTVRVKVGVRNTGSALDFYHISATYSDTAFKTIQVDSLHYTEPNDSVYVFFVIGMPTFVSTPDDTIITVNYAVKSGLDTTLAVQGVMHLMFSTSDAPDQPSGLPAGFALRQNYPNPFNPTTTISYSLPRASAVRLEVVDVLGRVVDKRDLGRQAVGAHQMRYDASALSSGMYFYRIVTDYASQSKKMMLVK